MHAYTLKKEEPPVSVACNTIIECADLEEVRRKYFEERSLYSPFRNVIPEKMFDFLKEIGMFCKI